MLSASGGGAVTAPSHQHQDLQPPTTPRQHSLFCASPKSMALCGSFHIPVNPDLGNAQRPGAGAGPGSQACLSEEREGLPIHLQGLQEMRKNTLSSRSMGALCGCSALHIVREYCWVTAQSMRQLPGWTGVGPSALRAAHRQRFQGHPPCAWGTPSAKDPSVSLRLPLPRHPPIHSPLRSNT